MYPIRRGELVLIVDSNNSTQNKKMIRIKISKAFKIEKPYQSATLMSKYYLFENCCKKTELSMVFAKIL